MNVNAPVQNTYYMYMYQMHWRYVLEFGIAVFERGRGTIGETNTNALLLLYLINSALRLYAYYTVYELIKLWFMI